MRRWSVASRASARISRLHTTRILRLSEDLPVVVEIVDAEERVEAILPILDEMIGEGLMTLEKVQVIAYRAGEDATAD
jgi:PII-like signaling protein